MPVSASEILRPDDQAKDDVFTELCASLDAFLTKNAYALEFTGALRYRLGPAHLSVVERVIEAYRKVGWNVRLFQKQYGNERRYWLNIEVQRKSNRAA